MEDLTSYPSGSSPQDIQSGNIWQVVGEIRADVKGLSSDVKDLCTQQAKQSEDIAFIRGKLAGKKEKEERNFTWKHGAGMTALGAFFAFIAAKFS